MGSKRMEEKKVRRKEEIEDAAFKLFCEKGVKKTSVDDIVSRVNIAKGTFYLYFKNKQMLIDNLVVREADKVVSEAINKLEESELSNKGLDEKIILIVSEIIEYFKQNTQFLEFIHKNLYRGIFKAENMAYFAQIINQLSNIDEQINTEEFHQKLYLIFEMSGSVLYNAMILESPYTIEKVKPKLFAAISAIVNI